MSVTASVRMNVVHHRQVKKYSAPLRLWHWANTIVISGSLITVLINSTITNQRATSRLMSDELQKSGAAVSNEQVRSAAHALSDSVWDVHKYFGFCLAGLLLFRLVLEFFQLADQKLIRRIKGAWVKFNVIKTNREETRHELTVKAIYSIFYILLIIQVITGLFLAFEDAMAPFKSIRHSVSDVHSFCMYLIIAFIVVHLAGVFLAERKDKKGIVSDMINGGQDII
jgi:Ni/Fe-hydrogenase 1 B-type cytochrome subunit